MTEVHPELLALLRESSAMLVFTGAGVSTNSGIADYRGPDGIYKTRQPVLYQDFMTSNASRQRYWAQKLSDWESFHDAEPNDVHAAVARLEAANKLLCCVTQNVDGLHKKAGTSAPHLVELHGTNSEIECQSCHERSDPQPLFDLFSRDDTPPRCHCGGWLKPATISFGQSLRQHDLARAVDCAERCDLVIALGSSLSVYPASSIPLAAAQRGTPYVIINRGHSDHDHLPCVTLRLDGDVSELLVPAVDAALA
jgi:NAD-dependent deacetylase